MYCSVLLKDSISLLPLVAGLYFTSLSQTVTPLVKAILPSVLDESSGIEITNRNRIWSHNDSGGADELYEFDSTGVLIRTLNINNSNNHDWEDLAQDITGNFYIGDFGNNNNDRTNLKIYKINNLEQVVGSSVNAQSISFTYPDQHNFPPADALLNFDMEAMFWFNHSLYLFSKNRTNPYDGYTHLYKLPETPGTYTATLVDSFYLGSGPYFISSATAADISPDGNTVALLSCGHIYLFSGFSGDDFFGGNMQQLTFSSLTQKEGIAFISNTELYITDEKTDNQTGKLYYLNIGSYIITDVGSVKTKNELIIYPNPNSTGILKVQGDKAFKLTELSIFNINGEVVYASGQQPEYYFNLPAGVFLVQVKSVNSVLRQKLIVY